MTKTIFKKEDLIELDFTYTYDEKEKLHIIDFENNAMIDLVRIYFLETEVWKVAKPIIFKYYNETLEELETFTYELYDENIIIINKSKNNVKQIKFQTTNFLTLDIKSLKIYTRKYPCLLIAARADGLGARLIPLLNAMVLAKITGCKFGFVWDSTKKFEWFKEVKQVDNNQLSSVIVPEIEDIFNEEFIINYSYTDVLSWDRGYMQEISIDNFLKPPFSHYWGHYISHVTAQRIFKGMELIGKYFPSLYKEIGFSKHFKELISLSHECANKLAKKFIAIQIRSGDIVFTNTIKDKQLNNYWLKAMPLEIALKIIDKHQKDDCYICLFGDDFDGLKAITSTLKDEKIILIDEIIKDYNLSSIERNFFEINFMSLAFKIYAGDSSFARTAAYIGHGNEACLYYELFDFNEMVQIITKYFNKVDLHPYQKAYSNYFAFKCLQHSKQDNQQEELYFLKAALSYDKENALYIIEILVLLLKNKDFNEIENFLKDKINSKFLNNYFSGNLFQKTYSLILKAADEVKTKHLSILALNIRKHLRQDYKIFGAVTRIKNHLAYKLGVAIIENSKSLMGYIRMPYVLSYIKDKHKQEQKAYQALLAKDPRLKLPKIEEYTDYKEGLKVKKHLSYKLGEALIRADKTWYLGGYVKFYFEVKKLKQRFKKNKN